jgi:hypothetical protein
MKMLATAFALAVLATSVGPAGAETGVAAQAEVRPDTIDQVQWGRPPWARCRVWVNGVCRDRGWRGRNWRAWYGRPTCGPGHRWWIDRRGRWRRC